MTRQAERSEGESGKSAEDDIILCELRIYFDRTGGDCEKTNSDCFGGFFPFMSSLKDLTRQFLWQKERKSFYFFQLSFCESILLTYSWHYRCHLLDNCLIFWVSFPTQVGKPWVSLLDRLRLDFSYISQPLADTQWYGETGQARASLLAC